MGKMDLTRDQLKYCKETIESAILSFVDVSHAKGVVVALSGGIDSAVVLKLASAVVDSHVLIMPEVDVTEQVDIRDAIDLSCSLGVNYSIIEIDEVANSVKKGFPWVEFDEGDKKLSLANIKPRVRMIFNYLLANLEGRLVLGTSNKTELLLGYLTKFGDGGCDFEPIGDLYKTQVRQLAKYLGVPESIIEKKPSAGLWKGQTDEGELGVVYDLIDKILYLFSECNYSVEKTAIELDLSMDLVRSICSRVDGSKHKRMMPEVVELNL